MLELLKEIEKNILIYSSIISNKKDDILKTRKIIESMNKNILDETRILNNLISEEVNLQTEKNRILNCLKFNSDSGFNQSDNDRETDLEGEINENIKSEIVSDDRENIREKSIDEIIESQKIRKSVLYCPFYPMYCVSMQHDKVECHSTMAMYYGKIWKGKQAYVCPSCKLFYYVPYSNFYENHKGHLCAFKTCSKINILKSLIRPGGSSLEAPECILNVALHQNNLSPQTESQRIQEFHVNEKDEIIDTSAPSNPLNKIIIPEIVNYCSQSKENLSQQIPSKIISILKEENKKQILTLETNSIKTGINYETLSSSSLQHSTNQNDATDFTSSYILRNNGEKATKRSKQMENENNKRTKLL